MDKVYAIAVATIVAASGEHADSGLPGVRPGTRTPFQEVETIRGIPMGNRWDIDTLRSTIPRDLLNCAERTVWISCAWTLQELILSTRVIYFMNNAVWYLSRDHVFEEDIYEDLKARGGAMLQNLMRELSVPFKPMEDVKGILESYSHAVHLYSTRAMSHQSDALNAFAAVLNLLHPGFKGGYLAGLPALHLERVLLWLPDATITRRRDQSGNVLFPSWSWAGWSGRIEMPTSRECFGRVKWLCPDLDAVASGVPLGDKGDSAIDQLDNARCLEFETLTAKLPLRPGRGAIWRMNAASDRHLDPEICSYYVSDITQRRDIAGIVYIHADGVKQWDDITGSSRPPDDDADLIEWAQSFSLEEWRVAKKADETINPSYNVDLDWGMYDVLVITWEGGVARRVGAGRVFAEALCFANPVRKKIILE